MRGWRPLLAALLAGGAIVGFASIMGWAIHRDAPSGDAPPTGREPARFQPDDTTVESCGNELACLAQAYGNLAYTKGHRAAIEELRSRVAADPKLESRCHLIVHELGAGAMVARPDAAGEMIASGDALCSNGFYHGVITYALLGHKPSDLVDVIRAMCADVERKRGTAAGCGHPVGHAVMLYEGNDLQPALDVCDGLEQAHANGCYDGAFMVAFDDQVERSWGLRRDDDPLYPCNKVHERHRPACYTQLVERFARDGDTWKERLQLCGQVPRTWQLNCNEGMARKIAGIEQTPKRVRTACGIAEPKWFETCISQAAGMLVGIHQDTTAARQLCETSPVSVAARCYFMIGNAMVVDFPPERVARECGSVPPSYRNACLQRP